MVGTSFGQSNLTLHHMQNRKGKNNMAVWWRLPDSWVDVAVEMNEDESVSHLKKFKLENIWEVTDKS